MRKRSLTLAIDERLKRGPASFDELLLIAGRVIPPSVAIRRRRNRVVYKGGSTFDNVHPEKERQIGVKELLRTCLSNNRRRGHYEKLHNDMWIYKGTDT